jgi:TetR/AcrR family transcriptional repressor of lmrAB and yxaGH operons
MISTAVLLFQRDGYHATSWRRLVGEAGTPWGSAHHHFPGGKEQLGVEAVRRGAEMAGRAVDRAFSRHDTAEDAIRWWFGKAGQWLARDDYRGGCPLATVTLETAHTSAMLTAACRDAFDTWQRTLVTGFTAHGYSPGAAEELAVATINGFEGALLLCRIRRNTRALDTAAEQLAVLLEARREAG